MRSFRGAAALLARGLFVRSETSSPLAALHAVRSRPYIPPLCPGRTLWPNDPRDGDYEGADFHLGPLAKRHHAIARVARPRSAAHIPRYVSLLRSVPSADHRARHEEILYLDAAAAPVDGQH